MNSFIATITATTAELRTDESFHCAKVLRKKAGDKILVIDGAGNGYEAELTLVHEKKCQATILQQKMFAGALPYYLHLAIAPTKQIDRIEWMLEKCIEVGIHEVSFFVSNNSERSVIKHERMLTIAESAVKQSLQARIPKINPLVNFQQVLLQCQQQHIYIAHCRDAVKQPLQSINFKTNQTAIVIGPEGDFTSEEIGLAGNMGASAVSLGEHRLRTETAGLYACMAASLFSN